MDGVMNDEVHGQSNHPKMGGPQNRHLWNLRMFQNKKGSKLNGPINGWFESFRLWKVGILWWTTHSLTHSLGQWNMQSQANHVVFTKIFHLPWPLPVFPDKFFFLSFVRDCYKLVGHLIIFYGYGYPFAPPLFTIKV
jgi:hypothetical protein